jgi:hypothetical protein
MSRRHAPWSAVDALVEEGTLAAVRYGPHRYYVRTVGRRPGASESRGRSSTRNPGSPDTQSDR